MLLLFALLAVVLLYWWQSLGMTTGRPVFPVDDAYITLQNALVLSGQRPEHFIDASMYSGATSLWHTLLVSILVRFLPPETSLSLAGLLGAFACAGAMMGIGRRAGHGVTVSAILAFVGLASGYMPHHLTNGLETSWAVAAVAWCIYLAMDPPRHPVALPFLLVALPFIRPELGLLTLLVAGYWLYAVRARLPILYKGVAVGIASVLLWVVLAQFLNWPLIPNTVQAKKFYFAEGCLPALTKKHYVLSALGVWFLPYGPVVLGVAGWLRDRLGLILAVFPVVFFAAYFLSFPGALGHYEGRYMAIMVPMLVLGWARLLSLMLASDRRSALALIALSLAYAAVFSAPTALATGRAGNAFTVNELLALSNWMQANIRPDARVMTHDAGVLGYVLSQPMVDMVGLKTSRAMALHEQLTWPSCGVRRKEAVANLVAQEKPDYIVILNDWDRIFGLSPAVARAANMRLVWDHPKGYNVYALTYPQQPR